MYTINRPQNAGIGFLNSFECQIYNGEILFEFGSTFMKDDSIKYQEITKCHAFWDANMYIESLV